MRVFAFLLLFTLSLCGVEKVFVELRPTKNRFWGEGVSLEQVRTVSMPTGYIGYWLVVHDVSTGKKIGNLIFFIEENIKADSKVNIVNISSDLNRKIVFQCSVNDLFSCEADIPAGYSSKQIKEKVEGLSNRKAKEPGKTEGVRKDRRGPERQKGKDRRGP